MKYFVAIQVLTVRWAVGLMGWQGWSESGNKFKKSEKAMEAPATNSAKIVCKAKNRLERGNKKVLGGWNLGKACKLKGSENQWILSKGRQIVHTHTKNKKKRKKVKRKFQRPERKGFRGEMGRVMWIKTMGRKETWSQRKGQKNGSWSLFMSNNVQFAYGLIGNIFKPSKHGQLWKLERPWSQSLFQCIHFIAEMGSTVTMPN